MSTPGSSNFGTGDFKFPSTNSTPPDTIQMKDAIIKHRAALKEVQNTFTTPVLPQPRSSVHFADAKVERTPGEVAQAAVIDVLLYKNTPFTVSIALAGCFSLSLVHYTLSGAHQVTFVTALCHLLLANLGLNFVRSLVSPQWVQNWKNSTAIAALSDRALVFITTVASLHDRYLTARNPVVAVKAGMALWALSFAGRYLSFWNLCTAGFICAFSGPVAYLNHQEAINSTVDLVLQSLTSKWRSLGLSRRQHVLAIGSLLAVLFWHASWSTRLSALLIGGMTMRCFVAPTDIESFRKVAEPYAMSARKSAVKFVGYAKRTLIEEGYAKAR